MTVPNNILFCGDPHGSFDHIIEAARRLDPMAVVLLGDLQPQRPLHVELAEISEKVWFVHGNHDTDSEQDFVNVFESELAHRNVHGRVVTLPDGTRLAGLGGVFRERVWMPPNEPKFLTAEHLAYATSPYDRWRDGPSLRHWSSICKTDVDVLVKQRADILVTHEAPSCHPHGFAAIDELARSMGVTEAFHGHHHDRIDYSMQWAQLGFKARGVGLCGITDRAGNVVTIGEFDLARQARQLRVDDLGDLD